MNSISKLPIVNRVAILLTLLFAFAVRSIIGPLLFRGYALWLYYAGLYLCLGVCLVNSFNRESNHLYASKYFYSFLLLLLIILVGLYRSSEISSIIGYGIALLVPFALKPSIKDSMLIPKSFIVIGVILFVGSLLNYLFPIPFRAFVLPLFSESGQKSVNWQAGISTAFPGFTSQVGYTSYFVSTAIGTLFCFRHIIYKKWFVPLNIILFFGLFLTGKRGPFVFVFLSIIVVYFCESRDRQRIVRVFQILMIFVLSYIALYLLARFTDNLGIKRIFDSIHEIVFTRSIEDQGREQLRNQAWIYFSNNPLFGVGWDNFKNIFTLRRTHVHNIYVQLLCETGVIGFSIFVVFFIKCINVTLKKIKLARSKSNEYSWLMLSLFMQVYFLLYGMTGNPLYDSEETILYFFAVGICYLPMIADSNTSDNYGDEEFV